MDILERKARVDAARAEIKDGMRDRYESIQMGDINAGPGDKPRISGRGVNRFRGAIAYGRRISRNYPMASPARRRNLIPGDYGYQAPR